MPSPREVLFGPWRAVPVLGVAEIITWGVLFYPPVLTVPLIARDLGWSMTFAMGGFSLALLVGGLASRHIGGAIDRHGGHRVMPVGALTGALGLGLLATATHPAGYLAGWIVTGAAMAASLYDPAFATLGRIFGAAARAPITALTLAGGFASTVGWPVTQALIEAVGWRGTYAVYAAVLAGVAAPLLALALPRTRFSAAPASSAGGPGAARPAVLPARGLTFALVAAAFAAYAFVPSALSAHLLAIIRRAGLDAGQAVTIGALFGPSQVAARICEFVFARRLHPLWVARGAVTALMTGFALLLAAGIDAATAAVFAMMFGGANGLLTIARGTVPLALFGAQGYGLLIGRIATPFLLMQAAAPLVMAVVIERGSDAAALLLALGFAAVAFGCFAAIRRPAVS